MCFFWLCVTNRVFILRYRSYEEFQWLIIYAENHLSELFSQNVYPAGWAAHHASQKCGIQTPPGINTILPLLRDKVSTFNMQAHLM